MFKVGDKVFYPMHGAGIVKAIEEKNFLGKKESYYIISIPTCGLEVMIPQNRAEDAGIRSVTDEETAKQFLTDLHDSKADSKMTWKERFSTNMEKIKTGHFDQIAQVIRDLINLSSEKGLNGSEKQLLNEARKLMISELALIKGVSEPEAAKLLKRIS